MPSVKDYVESPKAFTNAVESAIDKYVRAHGSEKSVEWKARNTGGTISGSIFSQCVRKAWYSFFTAPKDGEFSSEARRRMYLGYLSEEVVLGALSQYEDLGELTRIHHLQNEAPVNQTITRGEVTLSTTTDLVIEFELDGRRVYIPIEEKSTEVPDWQRRGDWWPKFKGYDSHRRQLTQWMYYAKENGLEVPFGVLAYFRRSDYASKYFIIMDAEEAPFDPLGKSAIELYSDWEAVIEGRMEELVFSIEAKTRPIFPSDVPKWMCSDCTFKEDCHANK